ncbi:MAG: 30S ribosomal protein S27ae [Candidatus Marsarchaeota archaeon]|jgi:small subunit ribosomal protein S27Ae|nr:30S ribosomal protein S27ae [Candidatus Marsarchaeota archaeon]MCL5418330.1 30S ribosomal protein S27ae [Candidatus Marsarchaeota archaeon]
MAKQQGKEEKKVKEYKPPKMCPKCNSRMAEHADRFTCGRCGYTEFKKK